MGWEVVPVSELSTQAWDIGINPSIMKNASKNYVKKKKRIMFLFVVILLVDSFWTTFSLEKKKLSYGI